jgi:hypothetical protein
MTKTIINLSIDDLEKLKNILINTNSRRKRKRKIKKVLKKYDTKTKSRIKKYLKSNDYNLDGIKTKSDMRGYSEISRNPYDNRFIIPQIGNNLNIESSINNLRDDLKNHHSNYMLENKKTTDNLLEHKKQVNKIGNKYLRDINERIYDLEDDIIDMKNRDRFQLIDNKPGDFATSNPDLYLHNERDIVDDEPEFNDINNELRDLPPTKQNPAPPKLFKSNSEEYKFLNDKSDFKNKSKIGIASTILLSNILKNNQNEKEIPQLSPKPEINKRLFETNEIAYNNLYQKKAENEKNNLEDEQSPMIKEKPKDNNIDEINFKDKYKIKIKGNRGLHKSELIEDYIKLCNELKRNPKEEILTSRYVKSIESENIRLINKLEKNKSKTNI